MIRLQLEVQLGERFALFASWPIEAPMKAVMQAVRRELRRLGMAHLAQRISKVEG